MPNPPTGLPLLSMSPQSGWAQLWCPCGPATVPRRGHPAGTALWPLFPPARGSSFTPRAPVTDFTSPPSALASLHFPFLFLFPFCLIFLKALKISVALHPDTFASSWRPLISAGCPQPPTATLGCLSQSSAAPLPTSLLTGLCNPKHPLCPLSKPQMQVKPTELLKGFWLRCPTTFFWGAQSWVSSGDSGGPGLLTQPEIPQGVSPLPPGPFSRFHPYIP